MHHDDPFHAGERWFQDRAGERDAAIRNGRGINPQIMPGAMKCFAQQPMILLGSADPNGNLWASIMTGHPGFVRAVDQGTVVFDLRNGASHRGDPLWRNIEQASSVGLLLIEPASRRRLRINGTATWIDDTHVQVDVAEAFANCPKYIQRRELQAGQSAEQMGTLPSVVKGDELSQSHKQWIERADTFFIASAHTQRGIDVSHRGGEPGFVRMMDDGSLRVPDYAGNSMFNTLGNLHANPKAGLLFVDWHTGRTLQASGSVAVQFDQPEHTGQPSGGTGRYWTFTATHWIEATLDRTLVSQYLDAWDGNPRAQVST